ncbi:hypothetical protein BUALT_Bualt08G0127500 [Buddleja alternifolia]|uniref:non-specific serine/threonine protein kinase n=1 Tax=Buddleja alternifolia TaxID=168488 RepID=A0AAV6X7E5_9LAMI|nr:hypothetical protein BUALT_Bualt08G0127500 [Buddleja alternifolia]
MKMHYLPSKPPLLQILMASWPTTGMLIMHPFVTGSVSHVASSTKGSLDISFNNFIGILPDELSNLRRLKEINVGCNSFAGEIPSWLGTLHELQHIHLNNNTFTGNIPQSLFNNTSKLLTLDMGYNFLGGNVPQEIGKCIDLEDLRLSFNHFNGNIPSEIGSLVNLKILYLSNNSFGGGIPKQFGNLTSLNILYLDDNKLTGELPQELSNLAYLETFDVGDNALSGSIPSFMFNISTLKIMRLDTNNFSGSLPSTISMGFSLLNLEMLDLGDNRLMGEIPNYISNASKLTHLGMYMNSFSGPVPSFANPLNGVLPTSIGNLSTSLQDFRATECGIMGAIPPEIGNLINLQILALYSNQLTVDVALALEYLHYGHTFPIVHCDIKPSNVLLDVDMTAHVADFGLSKLFDEGEVVIQTNTLATIGYIAPEYGSEGKVSTNGDVYSYGILLLEMFTRKKPTDDMFSEEMSLKDWVSEALLQQNAVNEIVTPGLLTREDQHFSSKEKCVSSVFRLAMECLAFSPEERINTIEIVAALQKIKSRFLASNRLR